MIHDHSKPRPRGLYLWIGVYALALVACGIYFMQRQETATRQMEAVMLVSERIQEYVSKHHDWPRSWADLDGAESRNGRFQLPRDRERVAEFISIDFQARLPEIALQTPATFTGFRVKSPISHDYSSWYRVIIYTADQATGTQPATTPVPGR